MDRLFQHLNLVEKDYFGLRFVDSSNQTVSENYVLLLLELEIKFFVIRKNMLWGIHVNKFLLENIQFHLKEYVI